MSIHSRVPVAQESLLPKSNRQRLSWEEGPGRGIQNLGGVLRYQLRTLGIPESQTLFPSENFLELFSPTSYTQSLLVPTAGILQIFPSFRACKHAQKHEEHGNRHTGPSGSREVSLPASLIP